MDIYWFGLVLGGAGLGIMALSGLGRHGNHGGHHGAHHGGHHGGHHVAHHGADAHGHHAHHGHHTLWSVVSPRVVFSALLGFGATGILARGALGGAVLFALAVVGGVVFERFVVTPVWNFLLRFASAPARTLESTLLDEARAASGFDANGQGLVALELDGQVVQVLGTLRPEDRALGLRVRAGDRLRIEDVDAERHRCTVSYVGR
jgi:hypothetical protein